MSSELTSEDEEVAKVLWEFQDLAPAAECLDRRRRLMYLQWGCKKKKSTKCVGGKGKRRGERISPTTPLLFNPILNPNPNSSKTFQEMSPRSQWLEKQKQLIQFLSCTKAHLQRSVEEAKKRFQMLKEKNVLLKSMVAMKQQQQMVPDLFRAGPPQQQRRSAFDLNRSPAAEEAALAWQQRKLLSEQARKRRKLLMKAKCSSSQKLAVNKMS